MTFRATRRRDPHRLARNSVNEKSGLSFNVKRRLKFGWQHPLHRSVWPSSVGPACRGWSHAQSEDCSVCRRGDRGGLHLGPRGRSSARDAGAPDRAGAGRGDDRRLVSARRHRRRRSRSFKEFDFTQTNNAFVWPASWRIDQKEMGDACFIGAGFGYQWNSWLRFDATAEYRAKTRFKAIGSYTEFCPGGRCFDVYDGNHSAVVVMANAYIDLGTWMCLTPFIGAGVGFALPQGLGDPRRRLHLRRHHRLRLRPERLHRVEVRLGAACRRRLQREQQFQDGAGLPLPQHG